MPRYSIIIPAYNESARLGATLDHVLGYVSRQGWDAEIIVVNDGSRDQTPDLVRARSQEHPNLRLLDNPGNRGKGYSVRNGMLNANGDLLLFSDADLSSPIEEAGKQLQAVTAGADVAIGSRWLNDDLQTERQSLSRQLFGRVFNLILRVVLGLRFKDTQCGFKAFTRTAAKNIFPRQRIERWGFDPEIIFIAQKLGYCVAEIAVSWAHNDNSTISPLRDGTRMFLEVLKVRWNALTGNYSNDRTS